MHANKGQLPQWWEGQHGDGQACRICRRSFHSIRRSGRALHRSTCEQWRCSVIVREGQASGFLFRIHIVKSRFIVIRKKKMWLSVQDKGILGFRANQPDCEPRGCSVARVQGYRASQPAALHCSCASCRTGGSLAHSSSLHASVFGLLGSGSCQVRFREQEPSCISSNKPSQ